MVFLFSNRQRMRLTEPPSVQEPLKRRFAVISRGQLLAPKGKGPHARHSNRRGVYLEDAADDDAISKHVEIVVIPFTGGTRGRSAFEGE
jgi:hypothetical protein